MTGKEALIYMITLMDSMREYFNSMIEWKKASLIDKDVICIKYEDLIGKESNKYFKNIFSHLCLKVSDDELNNILTKNSFSNLSGRKQGIENQKHHYRKGISGDWANYFEEIHKVIFKEIYGGELIELGYERDLNW
jgi:hypothetical protein